MAPALAVAAAVSAVAALGFNRSFARDEGAIAHEGEPVVRNPFELRTVIGFAALLAAILILTRIVTEYFGGQGSIVLAAIAGLADVDAITLSMTRLAGGPEAGVAAIAILVAVAANSASKSVLALSVGGRRFGLAYAGCTVAAVAAGAVVAVVTA